VSLIVTLEEPPDMLRLSDLNRVNNVVADRDRLKADIARLEDNKAASLRELGPWGYTNAVSDKLQTLGEIDLTLIDLGVDVDA
jgi:hypothetical protein